MFSCSTLTALSFQGRHSSRIIYAVFFWQYNIPNPSETGWNQNCLPLSVHAQAGEQWSACPDQCIPWAGAGPRAALPMWTAQEGALGFPKPNIGMRELPFICLNSLIFICLHLPLVRNEELPLSTVISAERPGPDHGV